MESSFMFRLWFMQKDITSHISSTRPNLVYGVMNKDLGIRDENMRKSLPLHYLQNLHYSLSRIPQSLFMLQDRDTLPDCL